MLPTEGAGVVLKGNLVTLRPLVLEDAARTLRWRLSQRAEILQEGARSEDDQRAWIAAHVSSRDELNFILEFRGAPVGMVALHDIDPRNRSTAMGRLLIGEPAMVGQSPVFFESELLLSDYAFDELKMHKIYGDIMEVNVGMIRTRLYLGYRQDGILREHYFWKGTFKNAIAVSLLEDEYRAVCRPKLLQMISFLSRLS